MSLPSIGVEADGPRRHTSYCRVDFHLPTRGREPLSHTGNATIGMGGERHVPARDQIRNRRWAVDFDIPKHGGNARQAQPLTNT
ncbi:hypothetical protein [Streptomyces lydicus]|uniref:hypothetical protein n=1 Tax=Streptomyces lydicus TaxID=47763 RepID=UPI0037D68B6F